MSFQSKDVVSYVYDNNIELLQVRTHDSKAGNVRVYSLASIVRGSALFLFSNSKLNNYLRLMCLLTTGKLYYRQSDRLFTFEISLNEI